MQLSKSVQLSKSPRTDLPYRPQSNGNRRGNRSDPGVKLAVVVSSSSQAFHVTIEGPRSHNS